MSIYTSIIKYFTLSVSEYVATNVSEKKQVTFLREPNPCCAVVSHMCACKLSLFQENNLSNSRPHWVECRREAANHLSRSLETCGKYHFIEAKIDKLTESSDTTPNSVSTSTWLCVTSNMKSTSHKMWQTSLLYLELL